MKLKTLITSCAAFAAVVLITGCAPSSQTGKLSGESKLRNAGSAIYGLNSQPAQTNNASIDINLQSEIIEPFGGLIPSENPYAYLMALSPNAKGSIRVIDRTLKFDYSGYVMFGNIISNNQTIAVGDFDRGALPQGTEAKKSKLDDNLTPEFRVRMEKTYKVVKKIQDIHTAKGKKLDSVFYAAGHGRHKTKPGDSDPSCGSYFLSVTVQTTVDLPEGALNGFYSLPGLPSSSSPAVPAGETFHVFVAVGECGYYESVGVAEKGRVKIEVKQP